jgi:hypothetical protein
MCLSTKRWLCVWARILSGRQPQFSQKYGASAMCTAGLRESLRLLDPLPNPINNKKEFVYICTILVCADWNFLMSGSLRLGISLLEPITSLFYDFCLCLFNACFNRVSFRENVNRQSSWLHTNNLISLWPDSCRFHVVRWLKHLPQCVQRNVGAIPWQRRRWWHMAEALLAVALQMLHWKWAGLWIRLWTTNSRDVLSCLPHLSQTNTWPVALSAERVVGTCT